MYDMIEELIVEDLRILEISSWYTGALVWLFLTLRMIRILKIIHVSIENVGYVYLGRIHFDFWTISILDYLFYYFCKKTKKKESRSERTIHYYYIVHRLSKVIPKIYLRRLTLSRHAESTVWMERDNFESCNGESVMKDNKPLTHS
jgi:hypothetical protein